MYRKLQKYVVEIMCKIACMLSSKIVYYIVVAVSRLQ